MSVFTDTIEIVKYANVDQTIYAYDIQSTCYFDGKYDNSMNNINVLVSRYLNYLVDAKFLEYKGKDIYIKTCEIPITFSIKPSIKSLKRLGSDSQYRLALMRYSKIIMLKYRSK